MTIFGANGKKHPLYGDFGTYAEGMVVRSTGILLHLKPIRDRVDPSIEAFRAVLRCQRSHNSLRRTRSTLRATRFTYARPTTDCTG